MAHIARWSWLQKRSPILLPASNTCADWTNVSHCFDPTFHEWCGIWNTTSNLHARNWSNAKEKIRERECLPLLSFFLFSRVRENVRLDKMTGECLNLLTSPKIKIEQHDCSNVTQPQVQKTMVCKGTISNNPPHTSLTQCFFFFCSCIMRCMWFFLHLLLSLSLTMDNYAAWSVANRAIAHTASKQHQQQRRAMVIGLWLVALFDATKTRSYRQYLWANSHTNRRDQKWHSRPSSIWAYTFIRRRRFLDNVNVALKCQTHICAEQAACTRCTFANSS